MPFGTAGNDRLPFMPAPNSIRLPHCPLYGMMAPEREEVAVCPAWMSRKLAFAKLYPLLVAKVEKKGRTREEVDQVTAWLTAIRQRNLSGWSSPM